MTQTAYQPGFEAFGVGVEVAGDVVDKCRLMLEEEPETREGYEYAWLRYLCRHCGLSNAAMHEVMTW